MAEVMQVINLALTSCAGWFSSVFNSSGVLGIYLAMLFVALATRFIIAPVVGAATFAGASDRVRTYKEKTRSKGKYEKNQTGKYSR